MQLWAHLKVSGATRIPKKRVADQKGPCEILEQCRNSQKQSPTLSNCDVHIYIDNKNRCSINSQIIDLLSFTTKNVYKPSL